MGTCDHASGRESRQESRKRVGGTRYTQTKGSNTRQRQLRETQIATGPLPSQFWTRLAEAPVAAE